MRWHLMIIIEFRGGVEEGMYVMYMQNIIWYIMEKNINV